MQFAIEFEQEADGRWLAEAPELPGVMAYGETREAAVNSAAVLGLRVIADRIAHGELQPPVFPSSISFAPRQAA